MKNIIKAYFYYSKLERNGIFILGILCLIVLMFPLIYQSFYKTSEISNFDKFKNEIEEFEKINQPAEVQNDIPKTDLFFFDPNSASISELQSLGLSEKVARTVLNFRSKGGKFYKRDDFKKIYGLTEKDFNRLQEFIQIGSTPKSVKAKRSVEVEKPNKKEIEPFEFDPNISSKEELRLLGFSDRAANNLIKFRSKGGKIRNKKELSKIYGVNEILYEKLYPFIVFQQETYKPTLQAEKIPKSIPSVSNKEFKIEINTAKIEDWQKLYGVGPYYAKGIVKFRDKLGGFYSINQIGETYNLPDSTFQKIIPQLELTTLPQQLNLNTVSVKELAKHPYLKYNQAKIIINYRNQHGPFEDLNDLSKIVILPPELIKKLKPYFSLE